MLKIIVALGAVSALVAAGAFAATAPSPALAQAVTAGSVLPPDSEIQRIVDDRVVTFHDTVGLAVGVVEPSGRRLFTRGPAQIGNDDTVDGDTVYEIGSITKVFTALLLEDMARRGQVSLADPVKKYLAPDIHIPERKERAITLLDLATHTSGLPKSLSNVSVTDFNNPNADLSEPQFLQSLAAFELTRDIGSAYEYSNVGYQLLGLAIAKAGGADYETLLKSRILQPLHMDDTHVAWSVAEKDRSAQGYDQHLNPVGRQTETGLAGSDGMRSSVNDLLSFLEAALGIGKSPLIPVMGEMIRVRRPTQYLELKAAMGWHVATLHGIDVIWHNGQTPGFRSFIGFSPQLKAGVVVLSNAANTIDDIGVHILDKDTPLRKLYREVPINPALFDSYIGRYQVSDTFVLSVSRDKSGLYIQGTGQPRAELFAEADNKFFLRAANGEVTFQTDADGKANRLSLIQDGKAISALRIE